MIKNLLYILFLFFINLKGNSQIVTVKMSGIVNCVGDSTDIIENAEIILSNETDTIARIKSDKNGLFKWSSKIKTNTVLKITIRSNYYNGDEFILRVNDVNVTAFIEVSLIELLINKPHIIYYEQNDTHISNEIDLDLLKHQLRGLDKFCVELTHYRNNSEKIEISEKRIKKFKKILKKAGFNLSNFTFKQDILDCIIFPDCKGQTQGMMMTIDENCN